METRSQFLPTSFFQQPGGPNPMATPLIMPSGMQMYSQQRLSPGMQMSYPQQRLPIMVMPYHSKAADRKYMKQKRRKPKYYDSESDSGSESCISSKEYLGHRTQRKKKRQVLTPVISYVTRDGSVVYQKKIKKENAGDWLEIGNKKVLSTLDEQEPESGEITIADLKNKYGLKKRHHHHHN